MGPIEAGYRTWRRLADATRGRLAAVDLASGAVPADLTRERFPHEIDARWNVTAHDQLVTYAGAAIERRLVAWRDHVAARLVTAVEADPDGAVERLAREDDPGHDDADLDTIAGELARLLGAVYDLGWWQVLREAHRQGVADDPGPVPDSADVLLAEGDAAEALRLLAYAIAAGVAAAVVHAAVRAVQAAGGRRASTDRDQDRPPPPTGGRPPAGPSGARAERAVIVEAIRRAVLDVTAGAEIADGRGAAGAAAGMGRADGAETVEAPARIYASELLDRNTCDACAAVDGREYASWDDARGDYPAGIYHACYGGPRCRGTLVVVWQSERRATRIDERDPVGADA